MRHGLSVCGNAVMLLRCEVDEIGFETRQDCLDFAQGRVGRSVLNEYQRLVPGVNAGPM